MKSRLTKKQSSMTARIYAANHLIKADLSIFNKDTDIGNISKSLVLNEIHNIAKKLIRGGSFFIYPDINHIINHVRNKY